MVQSLHSENFISNEKVKRNLDFTFQNVEQYCEEMNVYFKQ
jgi:hypothetical protein